MELNQALNVLFQAIDVAVSEGAFKSSRDVATVEQAKQIVAKEFTKGLEVKEAEEVKPAPDKKK